MAHVRVQRLGSGHGQHDPRQRDERDRAVVDEELGRIGGREGAQYLFGGGFYGIFHYLERTSLRLPEVAVRLDLRYDRSSEFVFQSRIPDEGKRDHSSATLQTVFLF